MKKGLLMILCLSLLVTAPACFKKKGKSESVKVTRTRTGRDGVDTGKKKKTVKYKRESANVNGRPMRTETVREDMTMNNLPR